MKNVFIEGIQGTGKSTLMKSLNEKLNGKRLISTCIDFLFYLWDNDPYSKNA